MTIEPVPQLERHRSLLESIRGRLLEEERALWRAHEFNKPAELFVARSRLSYWSKHYVRLYLLCCLSDLDDWAVIARAAAGTVDRLLARLLAA
jgi:hypothetical protein